MNIFNHEIYLVKCISYILCCTAIQWCSISKGVGGQVEAHALGAGLGMHHHTSDFIQPFKNAF